MKKLLFLLLLQANSLLPIHAQVNLQTGSAVFSLPMFNWQDSKSRLNSIVALSYNSGNGLRVNDVASNLGQGWNLITGGDIIRMQAGEPDDQVVYNGNGTDFDVSRYPSGILYKTVPTVYGCPNALINYPIYGWMNQTYAQKNVVAEDRQLDYFAFQFNGKSGMFVLDSATPGTAKLLGDSRIIINYTEDATMISQGIRTKITSFTLKDVDGLIYRFSIHGNTKMLKVMYCNDKYETTLYQPKFKNDKPYYQTGVDNQLTNPWVISRWCLNEIEDPLTHRKILFNYAIRNIDGPGGDDIISNYGKKDYCIISHKRAINQSPELTSIVYPDGHTVTINYGAARVDLNGQLVISSVDITYLSRTLSRYELNTSYFILNRYGTPITDNEKRVARLCLKSVRKIGIDLKEDSPPYIFDYYTGSNTADDFVPPPFFYMKDIWGFYNGSNSVGVQNGVIPLNKTLNQIKDCSLLRGLCFIHDGLQPGVPYLNAKPGYAKNGLLRQIVYPTGGTLTYQYEQNSGVIGSTTTNVGGVHVLQTSSTDGGFTNGCANPISTNYNYVVNGPGSASSLWGLEMPGNYKTPNSHYQPAIRKFKWKLGDILPKCTWQYQFPGLLAMAQSSDIGWVMRTMNIIGPFLNILSTLATIQDVVTVFGGGMPISLVIGVIVDLVETVISCIGDGSRDFSDEQYYNLDLHSSAPLPAQFKRVEIVENSGANGKTIQEFTSSDDYPIWVPDNPLFSSKQRFAPWAYGLPKKTSLYDVSANLVKQVTNTYDTTFTKTIIDYCPDWHPGVPCNASHVPSTLVSCNCEVVNSKSQRSDQWTSPAVYNPTYLTAPSTDLKVDFYGMYTGRTQLSSSAERIYKVGSATQFTETVTTYQYNNGTGNKNYEPKLISTTQSNGDVNTKLIKYSGDYTGGALTTLVANNILNVPVESVTTVTKAGTGTQQYLGENVTEFALLSNGDIKPSRTLEQRFSQPQSSLTTYLGPGTNISAFKIPQVFTYNASGSLTGLKDEGNRSVTNVYYYDDKYIVATIINADPVADKSAYTSFENASVQTPNFGNWTLTGSTAYVTNNSMTGFNSFTLSAGKNFSVSGLNTARPYTVSFWATSAGITVTGGATLALSAPTLNGFTYYEYNIAQGTSTVTVAGAGTLDELRLYPKTARMRSTTYDPLIGKTSEADENNRIVYYEYDNLGRLRFIKDENRYIVKMFEYNNVSPAKQNGCPGIYYNRLISALVTRNNCSAPFQGQDTTYIVAANTYNSVLSQADADAQAENAIRVNAQNYANSVGLCKLIFYNVIKTKTDTTQSCGPGYKGGAVTYTVPAGRYSSIISQLDADTMALDEIDANFWEYANGLAHKVCTVTTVGDWNWLEGAPSYCSSAGGLPPHLMVLGTDINPNSATFNQTQWIDAGTSDACPAGNYYNAVQSQAFTRNNCTPGYVGSTVTYTVAAGTYSSTISQAAANTLATNDISANGQAYANANGTCSANYDFIPVSPWGSPYHPFSPSGTGSINFSVVLTKPVGTPTSGQVATLTGAQIVPPTGSRIVNCVYAGQTYVLTFNSSGVVNISGPDFTGSILLSGSYVF